MAKTLQERQNISGLKERGNDLEVLQYVTPQEAKKMGYDQVLIPRFGAEQFCGTVQDVKDVMDEHNLSGEFIAMRRPCGIIKRKEVVKVTAEVSDDGLRGPVVAEPASQPAEEPPTAPAEPAPVVDERAPQEQGEELATDA